MLFTNIHTDTLFPVFFLLFYLQYTQGELGSGLTFILAIQILLYLLNSICQQRELPLLSVAEAVKFFLSSFVLFWGKG